MSIRKHGNRYEVRVRIGGGQRIEKTLPVGATRKDAAALETALRQRQIATASGRQPTRLIDEAIDQWVATGATRLKSYQGDLRYKIDVLRGYTAGKLLDQIPDVASAVTKDCIREGLTAATANRYLATLRRVANLAVKWGWTDKPLGKRIENLPGEKERDVFLTVAQINALADAADRLDIEAGRSKGKGVGRRGQGGEAGQMGDLIRFAVLTGLRRGEILRLTQGNVVNGAVVLDSNTKSGRPRVVPLPPQACKIAARRLPFTLGVSTINERYQAAREAVGMPAVRLHDLRHAYAKSLIKGGAPMSSVRDLLGHSSLSVTSKYISTDRPDLKHAVRGLKL